MEMDRVVGLSAGSIALSSLLALVVVFLIRRRQTCGVERSLRTQMFYVPPAVKLVSDGDLESQEDPLVREVTTRRPQMSHSPTLKSITPTTRTRSMSTESQIVSPSTSAPETPHLSYIPSSPITYDPPSRKVSPLSVTSPGDATPRRLSPVHYPPPSRQVSPLPSIPRPPISRRVTTDATASHSLYSIAERPVVYTPRSRYYSAHNTSRQSLIHIEGTQNALPELPGCDPVMKKHHSWHSMRN